MVEKLTDMDLFDDEKMRVVAIAHFFMTEPVVVLEKSDRLLLLQRLRAFVTLAELIVGITLLEDNCGSDDVDDLAYFSALIETDGADANHASQARMLKCEEDMVRVLKNAIVFRRYHVMNWLVQKKETRIGSEKVRSVIRDHIYELEMEEHTKDKVYGILTELAA